MDRFIEFRKMMSCFGMIYLKSNMDRFIVFPAELNFFEFCYLKSNMDRFIVNICLSS